MEPGRHLAHVGERGAEAHDLRLGAHEAELREELLDARPDTAGRTSSPSYKAGQKLMLVYEGELVDAVVDPNALERSAIATALDAASGKTKPRQRKLGWMDWFLEKTPPGRKLLFDQATKAMLKHRADPEM